MGAPAGAGRLTACGLAALRLPAAIAQIAIVLAAACYAPPIALIGELIGILGSHVPHSDNDNNEDYHDYDCQDENELNHRTIQLAWPHRVAQARRTRPSTRVFPLFAGTQGSAGIYKDEFVTVTEL